MKKTAFSTKRLVLKAVLIARYVVLSFIKVPLCNLFRISLASFAVVISAIAFSPVDGLVVGFMGEFLAQVLGPYGLTPTTLLWSLPEGVRGLLLGLVIVLLAKKKITVVNLQKSKAFWVYLVACALTGIIASLFNTFALYVDSKMFGYYSYHMVFGVLIARLGIATVLSTMFGYIALPVVSALRRNKIIN